MTPQPAESKGVAPVFSEPGADSPMDFSGPKQRKNSGTVSGGPLDFSPMRRPSDGREADLTQVVEAWGDQPKAVKTAIAALLKAN